MAFFFFFKYNIDFWTSKYPGKKIYVLLTMADLNSEFWKISYGRIWRKSRGGVRTGAMGAIAPVDFKTFFNIQKNEIKSWIRVLWKYLSSI